MYYSSWVTDYEIWEHLMTIEAKIICDSLGPNGVRLTTYVLRYPRFIHSEFLTHRVFSRNASSSRAIPFEKQVDMILADPAMPLEFRENKKGMQAGEAVQDQDKCKKIWLEAMQRAVEQAYALADKGVHKQYVNRILEPYAHISVVLTATEYSNFFALRHHSMAQPEIAELAQKMYLEYTHGSPQQLPAGYWHLPFVSNEEIQDHHEECALVEERSFEAVWLPLIKKSVARCARVSYNNHDCTKSSYEQDCILYDRLLGAQPIHASPSEHQAQALPNIPVNRDEAYDWSGNFFAWIQYRKTLQGENITAFEGPLG